MSSRPEFDFIDWLRSEAPSDPHVDCGIGDDAAVLSESFPGKLLVATDMILDGTHFKLEECGPRLAGRKALAVNLSDIAAMAGQPVACFVSIAVPQAMSMRTVKEIHAGILELAREFDVQLAGGDTTSWNQKLAINVTIIGTATGQGPVMRDGARPGDLICVTGPLGQSIHGHHLTFNPRVTLAQKLHQTVAIHAMIDISDGLVSDLFHLMRQSHCGAELEADSIPVRDLSRDAVDERSPLEHALHDGEDFELLLTLSEDDFRIWQTTTDENLIRIGRIVEGDQCWLVNQKERERQLFPAGWCHNFS